MTERTEAQDWWDDIPLQGCRYWIVKGDSGGILDLEPRISIYHREEEPEEEEPEKELEENIEDTESDPLYPYFRGMTAAMGWTAIEVAMLVDPRLDPKNPDCEAPTGDPPPELSQNLLGTAKDLADCLYCFRKPPENNRNGTPHHREWDTAYALRTATDLRFALYQERETLPEGMYDNVTRKLLSLTIDIADLSHRKTAKPFLDRLVRAEMTTPRK